MLKHPGGEEPLNFYKIKNDNIGDATKSFEEIGHSEVAREILKKYFVGTLKL